MSIATVSYLVVSAAVTASVVVVTSVIAEASGPVVGASAASLPVSAWPTYIFLVLNHPAGLLSASALGSFAANAAAILFLATYARIATGRSRIGALLPALFVWLVAALIIQAVRWSPVTAVALNAVAFVGGLWVTQAVAPAKHALAPPRRSTRSEFGSRAIAIALFVASVLALSTALGPTVRTHN